MNNNTKHTANFLASSFLSSKRSLKKIYNLNPTAICILRYICDSIDKNFKTRKSFQTKLYKGQISKYCHCDRKTSRSHIAMLIRKRFVKYDDSKKIFTVGTTLIKWGNITLSKDMGKISPSVRSGENFPLSNSSNFSNSSNRPSDSKNQQPSHMASVDSQSTSFNNITSYRAPTAAPVIEEHMAKIRK